MLTGTEKYWLGGSLIRSIRLMWLHSTARYVRFKLHNLYMSAWICLVLLLTVKCSLNSFVTVHNVHFNSSMCSNKTPITKDEWKMEKAVTTSWGIKTIKKACSEKIQSKETLFFHIWKIYSFFFCICIQLTNQCITPISLVCNTVDTRVQPCVAAGPKIAGTQAHARP